MLRKLKLIIVLCLNSVSSHKFYETLKDDITPIEKTYLESNFYELLDVKGMSYIFKKVADAQKNW